jgi:hypothetical protein
VTEEIVVATKDIVERLFDRIAPLAALTGYHRDSVREELRREIKFFVDRHCRDDDMEEFDEPTPPLDEPGPQ